MKIRDLEGIKISSYKTEIVKEVRRDDTNKLSEGRFAYVTRFGDDEVISKRNLKKHTNEAIKKKENIFNSFNNKFKIFSITNDNTGLPKFHKEIIKKNTIHMVCFSGFLSDFINTIILVYYLIKYREEYDNILFYNTYFVYLLPIIIAKFLLNKKVFLDFEDDYSVRKGFYRTKLTFYLVKNLFDGVILINKHMSKYFKINNTVVVNSFEKLHLDDNKLEKDYRCLNFVFSGSLDNIRGSDLLIDLNEKFESLNFNYNIFITGKGKLESKIKNYCKGKNNIFFEGFVSEKRLTNILENCDIGLVLQKPDHKFSLGSFPSKIDLYSKYDLLVLRLV